MTIHGRAWEDAAHTDIMMRAHLDIKSEVWKTVSMRTTLSIDDDLLAAAKSLAQARSVSVGRVLSDLARRGLNTPAKTTRRAESGFPVFQVGGGAPPITLDDVKRLDDEP